MHIDAPNPRAPRSRSGVELTRAVRDGRRIAESLRALDRRSLDAHDDRLLAAELARFLVRRCEAQHAGWRVLREVLIDAGADVPWERCARLAHSLTADRVLADCAGAGRTPLLRVQHAAAEERARAIASRADPAGILARLEIVVTGLPGPRAWERALVAAVTARSREQAIGLLASGVSGVRRKPSGSGRGDRPGGARRGR